MIICDYCKTPGTKADPLRCSWVHASIKDPTAIRGTVEEWAHEACSRQAARAALGRRAARQEG